MSQRKAVTKTIATRYKRADKPGKGRILDGLCATTGWHRDHGRKALGGALRPRVVKQRASRRPKYGPKFVAALNLLLGDFGHADREAAGPDAGRAGGDLAPVWRAGH